MKSVINVVLTETSIAILAKNALLTSIPLRHWTTTDGSTWSSRRRPLHKIDWMIGRLTDVLNRDPAAPVMRGVAAVTSQEPPPPPTKKEDRSEQAEDAKTKHKKKAPTDRAVRKIKRRSMGERYMTGMGPPRRPVHPMALLPTARV